MIGRANLSAVRLRLIGSRLQQWFHQVERCRALLPDGQVD
jgi:hypothetical protein